jgi:hypothetical protein
LEKLTIRAKEDVNYDAVLHPVDEGMPATRENVLKPIFEKELRGIPSLKKLEVVGNVEWEREGLEFADETIAWLEDRERHRILQELRPEKAEQQDKIAGEVETAEEVKCDFCGKHHLWVECWNLCNFCGGYGHFRDSCLEMKA